MKQRSAIHGWPFCIQEAFMNPIPILAAVVVKALLEWWFED